MKTIDEFMGLVNCCSECCSRYQLLSSTMDNSQLNKNTPSCSLFKHGEFECDYWTEISNYISIFESDMDYDRIILPITEDEVKEVLHEFYTWDRKVFITGRPEYLFCADAHLLKNRIMAYMDKFLLFKKANKETNLDFEKLCRDIGVSYSREESLGLVCSDDELKLLCKDKRKKKENVKESFEERYKNDGLFRKAITELDQLDLDSWDKKKKSFNSEDDEINSRSSKSKTSLVKAAAYYLVRGICKDNIVPISADLFANHWGISPTAIYNANSHKLPKRLPEDFLKIKRELDKRSIQFGKD